MHPYALSAVFNIVDELQQCGGGLGDGRAVLGWECEDGDEAVADGGPGEGVEDGVVRGGGLDEGGDQVGWEMMGWGWGLGGGCGGVGRGRE